MPELDEVSEPDVVPDVVVFESVPEFDVVVEAAESAACPTPATRVIVRATAAAVSAAPAALARRSKRRAGLLEFGRESLGVPFIATTMPSGVLRARQLDIKPGSRRGR
jgi:hypothetical protein